MAAVKNKKTGKKSKPYHAGKSIRLTSNCASLQTKRTAIVFDCWLHVCNLGNNIRFDLPVKLHKHFINLQNREGSQLQKSFLITKSKIQFSFKINTGEKKTEGDVVGIDSGINALATLSTGEQYGFNIKSIIDKIKRKKHGSRKQQQARRHLHHYMNEIVKQIIPDKQLVVVERLKNINYKTKFTRRVNKNMRRSLGTWTYRHWLNRIQLTCEDNRVSYRSVNPAYTSQTCPCCGHTERKNRYNEKFHCQSCGYTDKADIVGARNILDRFICGPYGHAYQKYHTGSQINWLSLSG
jgi:putative transposase